MSGDSRRILENIEKRLEEDPENANFLFSKGLALSNLEKFERAIECFDKVIELDRDHKQVFTAKAYALSQLGKDLEASKCLALSARILKKCKSCGASASPEDTKCPVCDEGL